MELNNWNKHYNYNENENDIVVILEKDRIYAYNLIYPNISVFRKKEL